VIKIETCDTLTLCNKEFLQSFESKFQNCKAKFSICELIENMLSNIHSFVN
jgi:hypothetical protein